MTLILKTPHSDIHQCPSCGAQCAVDRSAIAAATLAQQPATVACHKCDALFLPDEDEISTSQQVADDVTKDAAEDAAGELATPHLRHGKCPKCKGDFLMPAVPMSDALLVECPHCTMKMPPLAVIRLDARRHIAAQARPRPRAHVGPANPYREALKFTSILLLGGVLIAAVPAMLVLEMTPHAKILESLATPAPLFTISNSSFRQISDANGSGVLVTVNLANIGTDDGTPNSVYVTLLDAAGNVITRRQIARLETPLAAGEKRPLVARFTAPAAPVADIKVSLSPR